MSGRILIIDTVATNRIVLKVKMLTAQFYVDACSSRLEAEAIISTNRPDLILINLSDPVEDRHEFCRSLRNEHNTSGIAIIAVGVSDTSKARFAALDAGADDVLPRPMNDTLLLARIRSLLRVRSTNQELLLRDGTRRALGFEEMQAPFDSIANITLISGKADKRADFANSLSDALMAPIRQLRPGSVLQHLAEKPAPDLIMIDSTHSDCEPNTFFHLVSDLKSRAETRAATQLVIVPHDDPETAAMFLDLGADDVVPEGIVTGELALRAKALIRRKLLHDRLHDTVRNGLHAAVTDPLTGLYNRRYVDAHLERLAEQSQQSRQELAVMMLDIDHFKAINDTYGHAAGDQTLVQLADRLQRNLRTIDLVARVGGEEFLVAMPRTTKLQARIAADRLRRLVNERPFVLSKDKRLDITASVGVATTGLGKCDGDQLHQVCARADAALYAAKSAGRNQVAISKSAA